jgi:uncharacterized protein (TIGR02996 family)
MVNPAYQALLRAVLVAPDDDLPRLILADWLEEHDGAAAARVIRRQIDDGSTATQQIPNIQLATVTWRRGLVEAITLPSGVFADRHAEIFAKHPITRVTFPDLVPNNGSYGYSWAWMRFDDGIAESMGLTRRGFREMVPEPLWSLLERDFSQVQPDWTMVKLYRDREDALLALSRAAITVGRKAAGLPPYVWPPN